MEQALAWCTNVAESKLEIRSGPKWCNSKDNTISISFFVVKEGTLSDAQSRGSRIFCVAGDGRRVEGGPLASRRAKEAREGGQGHGERPADRLSEAGS